MGLLDSLAGQVLGSLSSSAGGQSGMVDVVTHLLGSSQIGGLPGLIAMFEKQGLGTLVSSWIGSGQNLPLSADQLKSVIGSEQLESIAQKFGFNPQDIAGQLAHLLPQVVDHVTPGGQVPDSDALGGLLGMLKGLGKG